MSCSRVLTLLLFASLTCVHSTEFYFECLEERVDFKTAKQLCKDRGRNLVTIRNEHEETALRRLLKTENCTIVRSNGTRRMAWLNYQSGQWLDNYPMIYSNWPEGREMPSKCVKFGVHGWIIRKCAATAATILLCERRDDEDSGNYGVLLKKTTILQTIALVPATNGISVTFFLPSTTSVSLEISDSDIEVYLSSSNNRKEALIERRLIATVEGTKLYNVSSGGYVSYSPVSTSSEIMIFFIALSDCTLYNVNVFDTSNGTLEPAISWDNRNWYIEGPYRYLPQIEYYKTEANGNCKEGTYLETSKGNPKCLDCPVGQYQNLKNATSCKVCPPKFPGGDRGQSFCFCSEENCDPEGKSTEEPDSLRNITIATTKKPTTMAPEKKENTTIVKPITDRITPNLTSSEALWNLPDTTPIQGQGNSTAEPKTAEPSQCPYEEITDETFGQFEWSAVEAGQIGLSKCFYNITEETAYARRGCTINDEKTAHWETPDYTKCATVKDVEISRITSTKVTKENAAEFTDNLRDMTNNMDEVSSSGIEATVSAMEELENHITPEKSQSFVDISSNLLDASEEKLNKSKASLQNLMTKLAKSISGSETDQRIVTKNVDIVTKKLDRKKEATLKSSDTNIKIPKSVTSRTDGAYLVVYKTAKLFKTVEQDEAMSVISDLHFSGLEVKNSKEEIKLEFEELQNWSVNESQVVKCVFWNNSDWSEEGCRYDSGERACFCDHATPFTSILSFKGPEQDNGIEEPVNMVVWWIEIICFSASIISCVIFIAIILTIRGLRRLQSFKMHCNLAVALLLQYTGYLILDVVELEGVKCKAIGFLVHWLTLACFVAMFTEALSVYIAIVIVFDSHVSHIVVKVALFCWGTTGCLVGLYAGITKMEYYSCTSGGFLAYPQSLYFLTIPVLCILLVNSVLFGRMVWNTYRNNVTRLKDGSRKAQVISQLKMMFSLNTMLGVGYLIGLVTDFSFAFEIIFIIINGLAGLFLLCLFGIFNPMTQTAIKKSMRKFHAADGTKSTYAYKLTASTADKYNRETL